MRHTLAAQAFLTVARYDNAIATYMAVAATLPKTEFREYTAALPLKYGVNPHQAPAAIYTINTRALPFTVVSGMPGFTNVLDAMNAWQLVRELEGATGLPAAASFKHVSPAGAAVATPLTPLLAQVYDVAKKDLSPQAIAYVRARNADPLSSYGDFAAVSGIVDVSLAQIIRREVCGETET